MDSHILNELILHDAGHTKDSGAPLLHKETSNIVSQNDLSMMN